MEHNETGFSQVLFLELICIQDVFNIIYKFISLIRMKVELIDKMGDGLSVVNETN